MDQSKLNSILQAYKEEFPQIRRGELYKWTAVKNFQDHWDIDADDFAAMLKRSLNKTANLLASINFFPRRMIIQLADSDPVAVRDMFLTLYDDSLDVTERILRFIRAAEEVFQQHVVAGSVGSHYQTTNAISIYLFLRFPEKYYIYKYTKATAFAKAVSFPLLPRKGNVASVADYFRMCDEVRQHVLKDATLLEMSRASLGTEHYSDASHNILVDDIVFALSGYRIQDERWWPDKAEYAPGIDAATWSGLLENPEVFTKDSLTIMKRLLHFGGQATCKELSKKYGQSANYYNSGSSSLARRVATAAGVQPMLENNNTKWWPILFTGKYTGRGQDGVYMWRLRPELKAALEQLDLSPLPLFAQAGPDTTQDAIIEPLDEYGKSDFLREVFMPEEDYDALVKLIARKKNVIIEGPPGVGKTFAALRLAYSIIGVEDHERFQIIQFHQSYSYEDFILGYKPDGSGFSLQTGAFYQFCQLAEKNPEQEYFLVIDEINRGNLSKIFGELLMLIEKDYRGRRINLAYGGAPFSVPQNLCLIGLMNTADRSLALIDYALRRRFSFFKMSPAFHSDGFRVYQQGLASEALNLLLAEVQVLNKVIANDGALGPGFCIGHSYFCGQDACTEEWLTAVVEYDLAPTLREYWFDDTAKADDWIKRLRGTLSE